MGGVREIEISPQVAARLGAEQVARFEDPSWSGPLQCWDCSGTVEPGEPASIVLVVPSDAGVELAFAQPAHRRCSPSVVKSYTLAELQARAQQRGQSPAPDDSAGLGEVEAVAVVCTDARPAFPALFFSYQHDLVLLDTADRTDLLVSEFIRQGWHLTGTLDAPPPAGPAGAAARIGIGDGVAAVAVDGPYGRTDVTVAAPRLWYPAVRATGALAVFHGSRYLHEWERRGTAVLDEAVRAGSLVGGTVPAGTGLVPLG